MVKFISLFLSTVDQLQLLTCGPAVDCNIASTHGSKARCYGNSSHTLQPHPRPSPRHASSATVGDGSEPVAVCDPHSSNREWACGECCCAEEEGRGSEGYINWLPGQSPWDSLLHPSPSLSTVALRGTDSGSSRCSQGPSQCPGTRAILQWSILHLCPSRPMGHLCQEGQWLEHIQCNVLHVH